MPEKRIGGAWTHGDGGVPILAAQSSASAAIASNGQYTPLIVEENGGLKVNASVSLGANSSVNVNQIGGVNVATAGAGIQKVGADNLDIRDLTSASDSILVYGSDDGGTTKRVLETDSGGAVAIQDGGNTITVDGTVSITTNSAINVSQVGGNTAATGGAGILSVGINTAQNAINITQIGGTTPATGGTGVLSVNQQLQAGQAIATAGTGIQLVGANLFQVGGNATVTASAGIQRVHSIRSIDVSTLYVSGAGKLPQFAIISASAAGTADVIASASSTSYLILAYNLMSNGSCTAQFFSNTTPMSGKIPMVTGGIGKVVPFSPVGWMQTTAAHNFKISLSAAAEVTGEIIYVAV